MKMDIKSVLLGVFMGILLMFGLGARQSDGNDWGIAVPTGGKVLVKDDQGTALIVNIDTGKVDRIVFKRPDANALNYPSPQNGYELRLY